MSTAAMATYDAYLCDEWARLTREAYDLGKPILADADIQSCVDNVAQKPAPIQVREWH